MTKEAKRFAVGHKSRDRRFQAIAAFGREGNILINPYTGETLGERAQKVREFFRFVTDLHRWLGAGGERRAVGRPITANRIIRQILPLNAPIADVASSSSALSVRFGERNRA